MGLDRTYHAHQFIFRFAFLIFLFIPCGRLSWLPFSFLLHVKYTLSYRIVSYLCGCNLCTVRATVCRCIGEWTATRAAEESGGKTTAAWTADLSQAKSISWRSVLIHIVLFAWHCTEIAPFDRLHTSSCSSYIVITAVSYTLYRFQDKARYWSKIAIFHTPIHTTHCEKRLRIISCCYYSQPIQIIGLSGDVNRFRKKSSVYLEYTRLTDKQTDENAISIAERLLCKGR